MSYLLIACSTSHIQNNHSDPILIPYPCLAAMKINFCKPEIFKYIKEWKAHLDLKIYIPVKFKNTDTEIGSPKSPQT